jgi:hypothetical protein
MRDRLPPNARKTVGSVTRGHTRALHPIWLSKSPEMTKAAEVETWAAFHAEACRSSP